MTGPTFQKEINPDSKLLFSIMEGGLIPVGSKIEFEKTPMVDGKLIVTRGTTLRACLYPSIKI